MSNVTNCNKLLKFFPKYAVINNMGNKGTPKREKMKKLNNDTWAGKMLRFFIG